MQHLTGLGGDALRGRPRARRAVVALVALAVALTLAGLLPGVGVARAQAAERAQQAQAGSAIDEAAGFGVNDYKRLDTGTARAGDGIDYGYRFTQDDERDMVVFAMTDEIVVFVPQDAADAAGFDPGDPDDCAALTELVLGLDEGLASGLTTIRSLGLTPTYVVGQTSYTSGARTYEVNVGGERLGDDGQPKYHYAVVSRSDGAKASEGEVTVGIGHLVPASETAMEAVPTWYERVGAFLSGVDYRPLWVSLKTSAVALAFVFVLGIYAAWRSIGVRDRWKGVVDSLFTIPMVLPPTVCGFLLLLVFGNSTGFGRWLIDHGVKLVFTWPAAVMAAIVVSFPLMYRTARGAFEALDPNMLDAARTLGWSEGRIFRRLMVPLAWPSIAAGTVLAFARAMGEFGATLFVAGNYAGVTQTMPIAIYFQWMAGNTDVALFWVAVVIVISFVVILFINVYSSHAQRYRGGGRVSRAERRERRRVARVAAEARKAGEGR
ncbi:molybdate ABC transporter permease subunit [bacterium]|nr:molybdate ABC transporter permease subunit [bacterium]